MQSNEASGLHCLVPSSQTPYSYFSTVTPVNTCPSRISNYANLLQNLQIKPQIQEPKIHPSCFSNNSTSDEGDEQNLMIINERKHRRMISNRESARRSRMRKQRHLDELWSQVIWLRNENHQLIDKLNHVTESHDRVLQENVQLKGEASGLRQMLGEMQLNSPYTTLRDLEEIANADYLADEPPN